MKKTLYHILCLILGVMLSGCIEEYEADIPTDDSDLLVVEGTIYSGKENRFFLSRTQAIKSSSPLRIVTGAMISVRGSDGSEYMTVQTADGAYSCSIGTLNPEVEYYLHIENDGDVYESEPQKPLRSEEIADVRGVQNTPESDIDVLITPEAPFEPDRANYYSWTYDETWEVHPDLTTNMYFDTETRRPIFKPGQFPMRGWKDGTSSTTMVGASSNYEGEHIQRLKIYGIDQSDWRIHYRYSGLVYQRAISKGEYEYELARRQASSEMGGLFTPQPSSLPTNIHCLTSQKRVIGFVGCSLNTSEYRFFLDASNYSVHRLQKDYNLWVEFESLDEEKYNKFLDRCCKMVEDGMFLCVWEDHREIPGEKLRTAWATIYELDVRYKGAYLEKPDFWKDY